MAGQYKGHGIILVNSHPTLPAALGINRQVRPQLIGESQIIHNWAAGLIPESPVRPGNRLYRPVAPHLLINIWFCGQGTSKPVSHMSQDDTCYKPEMLRRSFKESSLASEAALVDINRVSFKIC
jgi:hypothetical protein